MMPTAASGEKAATGNQTPSTEITSQLNIDHIFMPSINPLNITIPSRSSWSAPTAREATCSGDHPPDSPERSRQTTACISPLGRSKEPLSTAGEKAPLLPGANLGNGCSFYLRHSGFTRELTFSMLSCIGAFRTNCRVLIQRSDLEDLSLV